MKMRIKNSANRFGFLVLLAATVCWTGCEMFASHSDPLKDKGWQGDFNEQPNQVIANDYQDYIQKLPLGEKMYSSFNDWLKDGKGQHAVVIEVDLNGTTWKHVLIYDKDNKRIKVVKYVAFHYRS